MKNTIRLMTHNVWNCDINFPWWEEKGLDCSASARIDGLVKVYKDTLPDIIGCQEVSCLMADLLKEKTKETGLDYTLIWGRFTPILYRADKFELVDSLFTTYPEFIEGFEGSFNDVKSKAFNIGVFREKSSGFLFIFATTHLWWKTSDKEKAKTAGNDYQENSDEAREFQVALMTDAVLKFKEKYNCPAIVVGDFNTDYNSKAVKFLFQKGFRHAHDVATDFTDDSMGYHYCYGSGYQDFYYDKPFECAIDHIFVIGERAGAVKRFERYSPEYYLPISDHSPAFIDFEVI